MSNKIGPNDLCPCGSGKKYKKCCRDNKNPPMGVLQHVLDFGSSDAFIARMMLQIFEIRDFIYKEKDDVDKFDSLYDVVLQNLLEAKRVKENCIRLIYEHTKNVTSGKIATFDGKTINIDESIDIDLNIWFKDFFIRGNMAAEGLIPMADFLGHKIPFILAEDKKFEERKNEYIKLYNNELYNYLMNLVEDHRKSWYKSFNDFRNKIEHRGFKIPPIKYVLSGNEIKPLFPTIDQKTIENYLELIWSNLFYLCEDITVLLLGLKVKEPFAIAHIPEKDRDPEKPVRYKVVANIPKDVRKVSYGELSESGK